MNVRGFSLVELLVALAVCALLSAAMAGVVVPARAAFESVPATLDLQQRARTGVDVLITAIRSAGADVASTADLGAFAEVMPAVMVQAPIEGGAHDGQFEALYVVAPVVHASQGVLDRDQPGPNRALTLAAGPGCPAVPDVCGFTPGAVAAIVDGGGRFHVFTVASTDSSRRELVPSVAFPSAYPAGSAVVEVEAQHFRLDDQGDGSRALVRDTAGGATQPIVDNVTRLGIEAWGGHPLIRLGRADFDDGPWLAGGPEGRYDADFLRIRRIDLWIRVEVAPASLRGPAGQLFDRGGTAGHAPLRWVPDRTLHASITLRNVP